jgi:hypothetical protein
VPPLLVAASCQSFVILSGGIAASPDSNLWFTESGGNKIGRITIEVHTS